MISNNPLNPVKSGWIKRNSDGKVFRFSQNSIELNKGWAVLFEKDAREIPISDLDCVLCGFDFDSKFIVPLPGLYDINYGFKILAID
jgi:hypothetical protein